MGLEELLGLNLALAFALFGARWVSRAGIALISSGNGRS